MTESATLIQVNGYGVIVALLIPPVLTALTLLAVFRLHRGRLILAWLAAFVLAAYVLLTALSIGPFYVPAMILSMTSAVMAQMETIRASSG